MSYVRHRVGMFFFKLGWSILEPETRELAVKLLGVAGRQGMM